MDGYSRQEEIVERYFRMEDLFNKQIELNDEISNITDEINSIPDFPYDLDKWIDGLSDIDKKGFGLVEFKKLFAINKKYEKLVEEREINTAKMKELVVDNLLDRIKEILDK
jgi:septation ring formation regulator EzrA